MAESRLDENARGRGCLEGNGSSPSPAVVACAATWLVSVGPWRVWAISAVLGLLAVGLACSGAPSPAAKPVAPPDQVALPAPGTGPGAVQGAPLVAGAAAPDLGQQLLDDLVRRANQEGELLAQVQSSWSRDTLPPLGEAFKKRFNLTIAVNLTPMASSQYFPVAITETRAGIPPTFDTLMAADHEVAQLKGAGGTIEIASWPELLAAVNPLVRAGTLRPDQISPGPVAGYAFSVNGNIKGIVYNTRLISKEELPKTRQDLADPKYKGRFTVSPFTSQWDIAPAVLPGFDHQRWLEVARAAAQNAGATVADAVGAQRVVLGEFAFALSHENEYRKALAKDPSAPVGFHWWDDFNPKTLTMYEVRSLTRHPAAATLFALWMTTPEAQDIWQPNELSAVIYPSGFGQSKVDQEVASLAANARIVSYLDNARTVELLAWYATPEGSQYAQAIAEALRGQ